MHGEIIAFQRRRLSRGSPSPIICRPFAFRIFRPLLATPFSPKPNQASSFFVRLVDGCHHLTDQTVCTLLLDPAEHGHEIELAVQPHEILAGPKAKKLLWGRLGTMSVQY